jgi:hypothetical protein
MFLYFTIKPLPITELYEFLLELGYNPNKLYDNFGKNKVTYFQHIIKKIPSDEYGSVEWKRVYDLFINRGAELPNDFYINILKQEIQHLEDHIKLQPGGPEYLHLLEYFGKPKEKIINDKK